MTNFKLKIVIQLTFLTLMKAEDFETWNGTTKIYHYETKGVHHETWLNDEEFNPVYIKNLTMSKVDLYFSQYNLFYDIDYTNATEKQIFQSEFEMNIKRIIRMSSMVHGVEFGINEFSRYNIEDFTELYTGFNDTGIENDDVVLYNKTKEPPASLDWTPKVGGKWAKHQGECKISYVFAAVEMVALQVYKKLSFYPILSAQQGYDCELTGTCKTGGMPHLVLRGLQGAGTVSGTIYTSEDMVERITKKHPCRNPAGMAKITNVIRLKTHNEDDLMAALFEYGPLTTTIFVSQTIKNYHTGVLDPFDCVGEPNHAVVLAGYGISKDNVPYWLVKNSWGIFWGESGYIRLIRGKQACGIGEYVVTVTVEELQPKTEPPQFFVRTGELSSNVTKINNILTAVSNPKNITRIISENNAVIKTAKPLSAENVKWQDKESSDSSESSDHTKKKEDVIYFTSNASLYVSGKNAPQNLFEMRAKANGENDSNSFEEKNITNLNHYSTSWTQNVTAKSVLKNKFKTDSNKDNDNNEEIESKLISNDSLVSSSDSSEKIPELIENVTPKSVEDKKLKEKNIEEKLEAKIYSDVSSSDIEVEKPENKSENINKRPLRKHFGAQKIIIY